jgi:hypothetical protein
MTTKRASKKSNGSAGRRAPKFRIRIVGFDQKPASEFTFNPLNYRRHGEVQREALRLMLGQVGWVQGVIENERTGNLIDGHARIEEAQRDDPKQLVPYLRVDLSPAEEKAVLATLDPLAGLAEIDPESLEKLYNETIADMPELDDLLADLRAPYVGRGDARYLNATDEWVGMPEFTPGELPFKIIVNFETEKARAAFATKHRLRFLKKEAKAWTTWEPFKEREDRRSLKYESAGE